MHNPASARERQVRQSEMRVGQARTGEVGGLIAEVGDHRAARGLAAPGTSRPSRLFSFSWNSDGVLAMANGPPPSGGLGQACRNTMQVGLPVRMI